MAAAGGIRNSGWFIAVGLAVTVLWGCWGREPTEPELKAVQEGARQAVAEAIAGQPSSNKPEDKPNKADADLAEANRIMAAALPLMAGPPADLAAADRGKWTMAMIKINREYDRRKAADGYLAAARWLKAELLDRPPADVAQQWASR